MWIGLLQHRTQQADNLLRTIDVGLEIPQVGTAVAIFFTGNLTGGHFFDQPGGPAHDFRRWERQLADALLQILRIFIEAVSIAAHARVVAVGKQRFFQPVEAGEFRVSGFFLIIVFAGVNAAVEVGEEFGNRLNPLIVLTRRRIERFGFVDITRFYRVGESFGGADQLRHFLHHVGFIVGNRLGKLHHIWFAAGGFRRAAGGHRQLTFWVA